MPQMEKFGYASARTTVTSADGSSSRARSAALIPASLPPIMTRCNVLAPYGRLTNLAWRRGPFWPGLGGVRDDGDGGIGRGDAGVQHADKQDGQPAPDDLRGDERRGRRRSDPGERVGEHPADRDRRVGEA